MSRTRFCVLAALAIAAMSTTTMVARRLSLGPSGALPHGPDTWKVAMRVCGKSNGDARLVTLGPIDTPRQRVVHEDYAGDGFLSKRQTISERRTMTWTQRADAPVGPISLHVDFTVTIAAMQPHSVSEPVPNGGEYVRSEPSIESDAPEITNQSRQLTDGLDRPTDVTEVLYKFVERDIASEPSIAGAAAGAVACLRTAAGDSAAKSRLLAALLRNRDIPARLVVGLTLTKDDEQLPHTWVEAWVRDRWLPMCPYYHHYGQIPRTFLVFGYGDVRMARGRNVRNLSCAFHVARLPAEAVPAVDAPWWKRLFVRLSPFQLPATDRNVVEFLLLLPIAALIICIFRNVVGLPSFGTFAPALVGMVFRDAPNGLGIVVFVGLILTGWLMRRTLDRLHLLQVPRTAVMLSFVVALLIGVVAVAHSWRVTVTSAVSLFPIVILTGLIERFWTLDEEDGAGQSFKVLLSTLAIAAAVALIVGMPWVGETMLRYPESLGLVVAVQLLLGRYTGFRLSELVRFRDFVAEQSPDVFVSRQALRFRRF